MSEDKIGTYKGPDFDMLRVGEAQNRINELAAEVEAAQKEIGVLRGMLSARGSRHEDVDVIEAYGVAVKHQFEIPMTLESQMRGVLAKYGSDVMQEGDLATFERWWGEMTPVQRNNMQYIVQHGVRDMQADDGPFDVEALRVVEVLALTLRKGGRLDEQFEDLARGVLDRLARDRDRASWESGQGD